MITEKWKFYYKKEEKNYYPPEIWNWTKMGTLDKINSFCKLMAGEKKQQSRIEMVNRMMRMEEIGIKCRLDEWVLRIALDKAWDEFPVVIKRTASVESRIRIAERLLVGAEREFSLED